MKFRFELSQNDLEEIQASGEFSRIFKGILEIHKISHDPKAESFKTCYPCRAGFLALLFPEISSHLDRLLEVKE